MPAFWVSSSTRSEGHLPSDTANTDSAPMAVDMSTEVTVCMETGMARTTSMRTHRQLQPVTCPEPNTMAQTEANTMVRTVKDEEKLPTAGGRRAASEAQSCKQRTNAAPILGAAGDSPRRRR